MIDIGEERDKWVTCTGTTRLNAPCISGVYMPKKTVLPKSRLWGKRHNFLKLQWSRGQIPEIVRLEYQASLQLPGAQSLQMSTVNAESPFCISILSR